MIAVARGVAVIAEITDDQVTAGEATLELGLEGRIAQEALPLTPADDGDGGTCDRIDRLDG